MFPVLSAKMNLKQLLWTGTAKRHMSANSTTLHLIFWSLVMFFLSKAYVSLCGSTDNEMQMRALLDSDSQARFITEANPEALFHPILEVQIPIAALGSAKTQWMQGMIVMRISDAVGTILHAIPEIIKKYHHNQLMVHNYVLSKLYIWQIQGSMYLMDFFLGADVLEEALIGNWMKDNAVVIRESIFDQIVSGPIQQPEFEDENPISADALIIVSSNKTEDLFFFQNFGN